MKIHHASAAAAVAASAKKKVNAPLKKDNAPLKKSPPISEEEGETRTIDNKEEMNKAMLETSAAKIESKTGHTETATGKEYKCFIFYSCLII